MLEYQLNVMISLRDRPIVFQKTIESIHKYSTVFKKINIYIYDNLSTPDIERFKIFSNLLMEGKISYFSYDTEETTNNCFPKTIIFQRWVNQMITSKEIEDKKKPNNQIKKYYLLIDSDMIVGPNWDEYFISAEHNLESRETFLHYLVKSPGGIPKTNIDKGTKYKFKNHFKQEEFNTFTSNFGGGSGFWFMNYKQIKILQWTNIDLTLTYGLFKRHDSTTWNKIAKNNKNNLNYVGAVVPPDKDNPLVLHLGGTGIGSICNACSNLYPNKKYDSELKQNFYQKELELKDMNIDDIWVKYKQMNSCINW